ncbi:MAG TPA: hypothetical protein VKU60_10260 [Chloroflexota bacterium]|nr:hypothetical protein [Chloroflexota bacterium]
MSWFAVEIVQDALLLSLALGVRGSMGVGLAWSVVRKWSWRLGDGAR